MSVNIAGLDKVALLNALWTNSKPAVFCTFSGMTPPSFDSAQAQEAVIKYIDYFCGRLIKSDLTSECVDPCGYDRDYGQGAFQRVVNSLR